MKHIIRDTNETKDVAAILATCEEIEGMGDNKFQLFYDYDSRQPIPKEEALVYLASGKACFIFEADEDGKPKSFMNIAGKLKMILDDSCPNGYYVELIEDLGESSSSDSQGLTVLCKESFMVDQSNTVTHTSASYHGPRPYDLIANRAIFDNPENYAGYCAVVHVTFYIPGTDTPVLSTGLLQFSSAIKIMEMNGKAYGIMSFSGLFDMNDGEANPITVRYTFMPGDNGEDSSNVELVLPK